ncbi:hypothetical protein ASG01_05035 [Chryseobacterium sp. Leaf180]|jgi:hypothetical protein|uniref:2TM domain-containing protein n=1 Tax=Chryseobacterium sp. Leaf180 TaxID=1736289 RepID=UPI0006F82291|nr:2TM domain-containing protein [Chryseobacterium sp. Leaf180]KQR95215.1 hypothetical protein ASG01_05035 [Chryseobacterium sp. Leaf180]
MNYQSAYYRVKEIKKLYKSIFWFAIISIIIIFRNFYKTGELLLPNIGGSFILTIWAVIIIARVAKLFIFNAEWEESIYRNEVDKMKKQPLSEKF